MCFSFSFCKIIFGGITGNKLIDLILESFPKIIGPGLLLTIPLTIVSFILAMIIAIAVAIVMYKKVRVLKDIGRFYIWVIRGTPLLIQLYVVFFGLSQIGWLINPIACVILVFSLNEGAYCAETVRGAMESIPRGQVEAGTALGMSYMQVMIHIVLPQALRTAFPALTNSFLSMLKDTSLAANITVAEMFMSTQRIVARTYEPLPLYIELAFIYLMFCTVITKLQRYVEKKMNQKYTI